MTPAADNVQPSPLNSMRLEPLGTEVVKSWYEVALCEAGEFGEAIVKDVKITFEPRYMFLEGLHADRYYAQAYRRVEVCDDGAIWTDEWSTLNLWRKPQQSQDYEERPTRREGGFRRLLGRLVRGPRG